ncbi:MAG: PilZ domain-containing protein [Thermodesulfovibrionales bacterium]
MQKSSSKKIHLIETVPDGLKKIKSYLSEMNGNYTQFCTLSDSVQSGEVPELFILLADKNFESFVRDIDTLKNNNAFSAISRIVLLPYKMPENFRIPSLVGLQSSFMMPVDKLPFLSTVAEFLKIPQRRIFEILITIQPEESNIKYSGLSVDFSETGMAFKCSSELPVGKKITLSFIDPALRKRLLFSSEIIRTKKIDHENTYFYGVRFVDLKRQGAKELRLFITGKE